MLIKRQKYNIPSDLVYFVLFLLRIVSLHIEFTLQIVYHNLVCNVTFTRKYQKKITLIHYNSNNYIIDD